MTTHQEVAPDSILSVIGSLTPFSDFNQSPRNVYQCQVKFLLHTGTGPHAQVHTHACIHLRTHTPTHACMHSHTHALTHPRTHACTHTHTHARARTRTHAHTCTSEITYARTRTHVSLDLCTTHCTRQVIDVYAVAQSFLYKSTTSQAAELTELTTTQICCYVVARDKLGCTVVTSWQFQSEAITKRIVDCDVTLFRPNNISLYYGFGSPNTGCTVGTSQESSWPIFLPVVMLHYELVRWVKIHVSAKW